jgi:hypothetical protein
VLSISRLLWALPAAAMGVICTGFSQTEGIDRRPQFRGPNGSGVADGSLFLRTMTKPYRIGTRDQ